MLTEEIPRELAQCSKLYELNLETNFLDGEIPLDIWQLQRLEALMLNNNRLTGSLPTTIGDCSSLTTLNLSGNKFTGPIPASVGNLHNLQFELDLSGNLLNGSIPPALGNLRSVQNINLASNHLSGSIPATLGECSGLEQLDISKNALDGTIPVSLADLKNLKYLNLSYNDLEGSIPSGGVFEDHNGTFVVGNSRLCGQLVQNSCVVQSTHNRVWIEATLTVIGVAALAAGLVVFLICNRRRVPQDEGRLQLQWQFKADTIRLATEGFSASRVVGSSLRSTVYRASLPGQDDFAVKLFHNVSNGESGRHDRNLVRELEIYKSVRHRNLLKVVGVCFNLDLKALILEFMSNGSLDKHLHEGDVCELSLTARFKILAGVAHGMAYLHHESSEPIIHCDLKPSNILLDGDLEPKVSDFGISRFVTGRNHDRGVATASALLGTTGYIPPEYGISTRLSTKGDVYSFGMVVLETLTRMRPGGNDFGSRLNLVEWVATSFPDRVVAILDPSLVTVGDEERWVDISRQLLEVGLFCTRECEQDRPPMNVVVDMLSRIGSTTPTYPSLEILIERTPPSSPTHELSAHLSSNDKI